MEPRIQYAKAKDGVSIAFWTMGEGTPPLLFWSSAPFSHIELLWQQPALRAFYEHIAYKRKLVVFDPRGLGMSAHAVLIWDMRRLINVDNLPVSGMVDAVERETNRSVH